MLPHIFTGPNGGARENALEREVDALLPRLQQVSTGSTCIVKHALGAFSRYESFGIDKGTKRALDACVSGGSGDAATADMVSDPFLAADPAVPDVLQPGLRAHPRGAQETGAGRRAVPGCIR